MPRRAFEENPSGAARALVEHLRQNPEAAREEPAVLAARFGLNPEFVRRSLAGLPEPIRPVETPKGPHPIAERADGFVRWTNVAIDRAAENPVRFVALSLVAAVGMIVALRLLLPAPPNPGLVSLRGTLSVTLALLTLSVQMAVFYRRRMVRFAVYGGLVFGAGLALPVMVWAWVALQNGSSFAGSDELRQGVQVFAFGFAMLLVGGLYGALAAIFSVLGGWMHLRREEQEWEALSRQELLERYFELGKRLDRSVAIPDEGQEWEAWPIVRAVRARPFAVSIILGFASGVAQILLHAAFGYGPSSDAINEPFGILLSVRQLASLALFSATAFLAGRALRGALCAPLYAAAFLAALAFPVVGFGPAYALNPTSLFAQFVGAVLLTLIGAVSGLGATIQRRAARERRLLRNDGSTIVAEMLEIQWRLEEDAMSVTVLVADAAKSTAMKVGADPLDVEYSFREYQTWIADTCASFGGRVHSIAGDGAVVAFTDAKAAVNAARRLQTDVTRFNRELNRLPKPFRLRLGLHAGRVAGELNDVQFTEVIDIAAHVESIAPVGGIAATNAVISILGEDGFLPLARDVDGQAVYIALVPTEA